MSTKILAQTACPHHFQITALQSPGIATAAKPGQKIVVDQDLKLPIMRNNRFTGRVEVLYSITPSTLSFSQRNAGQEVSVEGPSGQAFTTEFQRTHLLVLGEGAGMAAALFLAEYLRQSATHVTPVFLLGAETGFPFQPRPSTQLLPDMPPSVIAAAPLLEDWGFASRLASNQDLPGCFEGTVTELAASYLNSLDAATRASYELLAILSGSAQRDSLNKLALRYRLPVQLHCGSQ